MSFFVRGGRLTFGAGKRQQRMWWRCCLVLLPSMVLFKGFEPPRPRLRARGLAPKGWGLGDTPGGRLARCNLHFVGFFSVPWLGVLVVLYSVACVSHCCAAVSSLLVLRACVAPCAVCVDR